MSIGIYLSEGAIMESSQPEIQCKADYALHYAVLSTLSFAIYLFLSVIDSAQAAAMPVLVGLCFGVIVDNTIRSLKSCLPL